MSKRPKKPPPGRAVALVSGGLDSAVAAAITRRDGDRIYALTFDYGQRHRRELRAAARVAAWLEAAEHKIVKVGLSAIGGSALTDRIEVPKDRRAGAKEIPITYVPARNLIFLSIALGWSEVVGASRIVIGANAIDYSGYPDCRPAFMEAFQQAAEAGTRAGVEGRAARVYAPLINLSKAEIIKQGQMLGLDFSITHSCYDPDPRGRPCGRCDSCRLRARGFEQAGISDPLARRP